MLLFDTSRHGLICSRQARGCLYPQEIVTLCPLSSVARRLITVMAPDFVHSVFAFRTVGGGCIDNVCMTLLDALVQYSSFCVLTNFSFEKIMVPVAF